MRCGGITDLFVADADRLNDQQIDVFDDVLSHLIKADRRSRAGGAQSAVSDR